jgi:hypothetical protein
VTLLTLEQLAGRQGSSGSAPLTETSPRDRGDARRLRDEVGWRPAFELREGPNEDGVVAQLSSPRS